MTSYRSTRTGGSWSSVTSPGTIEAAAVTGLVRHTIRPAALMKMAPAEILEHVNQALLHGTGGPPAPTYCTAAVAALAMVAYQLGGRAARLLVVACAGHPSPILTR